MPKKDEVVAPKGSEPDAVLSAAQIALKGIHSKESTKRVIETASEA